MTRPRGSDAHCSLLHSQAGTGARGRTTRLAAAGAREAHHPQGPASEASVCGRGEAHRAGHGTRPLFSLHTMCTTT